MENILAQLKPNAKKILLTTLSKLLIIILIVIGLIFLLRMFVDFSVFNLLKDGLASINMNFELNVSQFISPLITIFSLLTITMLVLEYNILNRLTYVFHMDGFYFYENLSVFQIHELFIPYQNIVKITFDKISIVNSGNITVELTGLQQKSVVLKFIDAPEQAASDILKLVNQYRISYYAKQSEEYKYNRILDREPI